MIKKVCNKIKNFFRITIEWIYKHRKHIPLVLSLILLFMSICVILYYILGPAKNEFHSDCSDTITWAMAMLEGKTIINSDFRYACFLPFGTQLLMLPFVAMWGMSLKAHMAGMILFSLIFIAAIFFLLRRLKLSYTSCSISVSVIIICLTCSEKMREIFFNHTIYYSLGILFLVVGLILISRFMEKKSTFNLVLLGVWMLLCSINGFESLAFLNIPIICSYVLLAFLNKQPLFSNQRRSEYIALSVMIVSTLIGYILGVIIIGNNIASYATGYSTISAPKDWFNNLSEFVYGWFSLLNIDNTIAPIASIEGICKIVSILAGLLLILVTFVLFKLFKRLSEFEKMVLVSITIMTAIIMFGYVFGFLSVANWRLSPIVCSNLILVAFLCNLLYRDVELRRFMIIPVVPLLAFSSLALYDVLRLETKTDNNVYFILAEELKSRDLTYGYATFWSANVITVVSEDEVKARCIIVEEGKIFPANYQTNINWYEVEVDEYFLIATKSEWANLADLHSDYKSIDEIVVDGVTYYILVFDYNIAAAEEAV